MKKILLFIFVLTSFGSFSQAPKLINYQGVARDASGTALPSVAIQLTITISNGTYAYTESHNTTSNSVGIFVVQIGGGFQIGSNNFAGINWAGGSQFINVTVDSGSGPQPLGPQQLVSVPYALYSQNSGSSSSAGGPPTFSINAPHSVTSSTATNNHNFNIAPTTASFSGGILTLSPGGDTTLIPMGGPWTKTGNNVYLNNSPIDNVGIGTTLPSARLNIQSNATTPNDLAIGSTGTGDGLQVLKFSATGNAASFSLTPAASGMALQIGNSGGGIGISVANFTNSAINATSTGPVPTINAHNQTGSGHSVRGVKTNGVGSAGFFDHNHPTSTADALTGFHSGPGAGVHASSGPAGNSALALWIENGHIKSTITGSIAPGVTIATNSITGFAPTVTITSTSTDVKGTVTVSVPSFTGTNSGNFVDVNVAFVKNYSIGPTVMVQAVEPGRFEYKVISQASGNFVVRIINNTPASQSFAPGFSYFRFNYFVIE